MQVALPMLKASPPNFSLSSFTQLSLSGLMSLFLPLLGVYKQLLLLSYLLVRFFSRLALLLGGAQHNFTSEDLCRTSGRR